MPTARRRPTALVALAVAVTTLGTVGAIGTAVLPGLAPRASAAAPTTVAVAAPVDLALGTTGGVTVTITNGATPATREHVDLVLSGLAGLKASQVTVDYRVGSDGTSYTSTTERDQPDGTVTASLLPASGTGFALPANASLTFYARVRLAAGSPVGTLTTTALAVDGSTTPNPTDGSGSGTTSVYGVPGAPVVSAVTPHDGSISVAVTPPASSGNSPVTGYRATAIGGGRTVNVDSTSPVLSLTKLTNGVAYVVTARARNRAGLGPASPGRTVTPTVPSAVLTLAGGPTFVRYGSTVTYGGRLTRGGVALAGQQVLLTVTYVDGPVKPLGVAVTSVNGTWSLRNRPLYNGTVTAQAAGAVAAIPRRVVVTFPRLAASVAGGRVTVTASSTPGFLTGPQRRERVQLLETDALGRTRRVITTASAGGRRGLAGYAQGINPVAFTTLLAPGTHHLVVKVIGTPVNTGASSRVLTVRV